MKGLKFSIGYNNDISLFRVLKRFQEHIQSLYFPIPTKYMFSARPTATSEQYSELVPVILGHCKELRIDSHLLLNATCGGETAFTKSYLHSILNYLRELHSLGLTAVVVTNPVYAMEIRRCIPGLQLHASVNCYIRGVEQAIFFRNLGFDVLTVDREVNRNLPLLERIANTTELPIKILLNEGCLSECPLRYAHTNSTAHYDSTTKDYLSPDVPDAFCFFLLRDCPWKFFRSPFVRPEDLQRYEGKPYRFKLSTRVWKTSKIERLLEHYIFGYYNGNLLDLVEGAGAHMLFQYIDSTELTRTSFFQHLTDCGDTCQGCGYCKELIRNATVLCLELLVGERKESESRKLVRILRNKQHTDDLAPWDEILLANAYLASRDAERARETSLRILESNAEDLEARLIAGKSYEKTGSLPQASEQYQRAIDSHPDDARPRIELASLYLKQEYYEQAIEQASVALACEIQNPRRAHAIRGHAYTMTGRFQMAAEDLRRVACSPKTAPEWVRSIDYEKIRE